MRRVGWLKSSLKAASRTVSGASMTTPGRLIWKAVWKLRNPD
jgi:hypothetical protein